MATTNSDTSDDLADASAASLGVGIVDGSIPFEDAVTQFSDAGSAFSELSSAVSHTADSYDAVRELHLAFARNSEKVKSWITRDLSRTIRNRVVGASKSGREYPIETLREVIAELDAFAAEGIDVPSLPQQVDTIIEALYERNWADAHAVVDGLLSDVPEQYETHEATYVLARARAALALLPATSPGHDGYAEPANVIETRRFKAVTAPSESVEQGLSPGEYVAKASGEDYESKAKSTYYAMAVHADPEEFDALYEYLYLTAKNDIERIRHRKYGNPSRGRLALTNLQLEVLKTRSEGDWSDPDRSAWVNSYYHVCHALMASSAQYESHRANRPEADFGEAANAYQNAAASIEPVNSRRMLKYLSKVYRHEANATTNPAEIKECHTAGKEAFMEQHTQLEEAHERELAQELLRYHHFKGLEIDVYEAFIARDLAQVQDLYLEYYTFGGEIWQYTGESSLVELCYLLSEGIQAYLSGDMDSAQYYFDDAETQHVSPRFSVTREELYGVVADELSGAAVQTGRAVADALNKHIAAAEENTGAGEGSEGVQSDVNSESPESKSDSTVEKPVANG